MGTESGRRQDPWQQQVDGLLCGCMHQQLQVHEKLVHVIQLCTGKAPVQAILLLTAAYRLTHIHRARLLIRERALTRWLASLP